jgi:hypothetical protein
MDQVLLNARVRQMKIHGVYYILYIQPYKMSIRVPFVSKLPTDAYYHSVYDTSMNNDVSQVPQPRIPIRYPPAFRTTNERRRAEAQGRREHATLTPSGRVPRARLSPEQRVSRRREVMRHNAL